jgi:hypothetical protein
LAVIFPLTGTSSLAATLLAHGFKPYSIAGLSRRQHRQRLSGASYLEIPEIDVKIHMAAIAMKNARNSALTRRSSVPSDLGISESFA